MTSYMLVNDVCDLQNIECYIHGDYAMSRNINASETQNWEGGKGFHPI